MPSRPIRDHVFGVAELASGEYVVSATGVLDGEAARELRDIIYPLTAARARILVDLGEASFVDLTTTGVLDGASRLATATGGSLVVVTRAPRVRTQLELCGSEARVESALRTAVGATS